MISDSLRGFSRGAFVGDAGSGYICLRGLEASGGGWFANWPEVGCPDPGGPACWDSICEDMFPGTGWPCWPGWPGWPPNPLFAAGMLPEAFGGKLENWLGCWGRDWFWGRFDCWVLVFAGGPPGDIPIGFWMGACPCWPVGPCPVFWYGTPCIICPDCGVCEITIGGGPYEEFFIPPCPNPWGYFDFWGERGACWVPSCWLPCWGDIDCWACGKILDWFCEVMFGFDPWGFCGNEEPWGGIFVPNWPALWNCPGWPKPCDPGCPCWNVTWGGGPGFTFWGFGGGFWPGTTCCMLTYNLLRKVITDGVKWRIHMHEV